MINRQNDYRKIKSPDYASSQERMNVLHNLVVDAQDARAVQKYAQLFYDESEKAVLKYAKENKRELLLEAALNYRVASQFCEMLTNAIELGARKEEILRSQDR